MRPPEFTGGNSSANRCSRLSRRCFNEAAGIHRRKRSYSADNDTLPLIVASMRPPEFTGGNIPRPSDQGHLAIGLQ